MKSVSIKNFPIQNFKGARAWLKNEGLCLRYHGNDALPLASLYDSVLGKKKSTPSEQEPAIEIANQLLESHEAIEVTVVAGRVCLVHRSRMPALYRLVREKAKTGAIPELSRDGKDVLAMIREKGEIVTGDVRKLLGAPSTRTSDDPAYAVLGELQRHLLVDRGPFRVTNRAIPYLSKEGYPYHLFEEAHPDLAGAAATLTPKAAREAWLRPFVKSTPNCPPRKLASIFKTFMTKDEIELTLGKGAS